jgi:hypothetical protein
VIRDIDVDARAVPWSECPSAQHSVAALRGHRVGTLRDHVRSTFTGISTCTHLNDLLRSLDGVLALARHVP